MRLPRSNPRDQPPGLLDALAIGLACLVVLVGVHRTTAAAGACGSEATAPPVSAARPAAAEDATGDMRMRD